MVRFTLNPRRLVVALVLMITYVGPYAYTYWRAQYSVFPRAVEIDNGAIDSLHAFVDSLVRARPVTIFSSNSSGENLSWTLATYSIRYGILHRFFVNYRNVPVLLDLTKVTFSAQGVFNGTLVLQCTGYQDRLAIPTGAEFLPVYLNILYANNNTLATTGCNGPGPPTFDLVKLSQPYFGVLPITLYWSISATVTGEMVSTQKTWQGTLQSTIG